MLLKEEMKILHLLRQGIYHATSPHGFEGIQKDGYIKPNTGGFPKTYDCNSYASHFGYIALFDFESASEQDCIEQYGKADGFYHSHKWLCHLLSLDREMLAPKLIPSEVARDQVRRGEIGRDKLKVPFIEVWYPEPIPCSWIKEYFTIPFTNPGESPTILRHQFNGSISVWEPT